MRTACRAAADGLTAGFGHLPRIAGTPLHPRAPLFSLRSLAVGVDGNATCLRNGKIARHGNVALRRLTSDARRTRFGSSGRESNESKRNKYSFMHRGLRLVNPPRITGH